MSNEGQMNFFKVERCGLYRPLDKNAHGCELDETLQLIMDWQSRLTFENRIPWDPDKARKNKAKGYCKDLKKNATTGDYFFVLWKSQTNDSGKILGVPAEAGEDSDEKVIEHADKVSGQRIIWGHPCYYWIIPEYNAIVSVKFAHSLADSDLLTDFITASINFRVKHAKRKKEVTDTGYVRILNEEDGKSYHFNIQTKLFSLELNSARLADLHRRVTHIVKRTAVKVASKDDRASWLRQFSFLPYASPSKNAQSRKVDFEYEAKPTKDEIKKIIEETAHAEQGNDTYNKTGFKLDGTQLVWAHQYRLKGSVSIPMNGKLSLTAADLDLHITAARDSFVQLIKEALKDEKENDQSSESAVNQ